MKQLLKQYAGGLILLALLTALIGACLWSSRPVRLNASELTPAETLDSLPGLELYLDTHRGHTLSMTVVNRSGLSVVRELFVSFQDGVDFDHESADHQNRGQRDAAP